MTEKNIGSGIGVGLDRRTLLRLCGAGAATLAAGGMSFGRAWAAGQSISGVMPGVVLPDGARAIVTKETGIAVKNVPYVSPTDTVAKLLAPGGTASYDLMISVTEFVKGPILGAHAGDEKVRPFDMSKVPNAANLQAFFKKQVQIRDGKTYMIPIFWGYDSPLYRTDHIPESDASTQTWNLLFDDKYAGRTALRDDPYGGITAAALAIGIADPSAMSVADLQKVKKFLIAKKKNLRTMWTKFGEAVNLMASGEVWAMYGWMPMRAALLRQKLPVANAWPKEGLLIWNQAAFMPKDSPKSALTEAVVNAMLSPEFGVALAKESTYGPVSTKALDAFSAEEQHQLGFDALTRHVALYPYSWPVEMNAWIEAWGEFKAA